MRTRFAAIAALALAAAALLVPQSSVAASSAKLDRDLFRPGVSPRAIIGFTHDVDGSTIARLSRIGITHAVVIEMIDAVGVLGPMSAYKAIATWSDVAYVDADSRIRFDNLGAKIDTKSTDVRAGKRPLTRKYDGTGVTVAVIDTGIDDTHPDLKGRVVKHVNFEPAWFMENIENGTYSDQYVETTGNPLDLNAHGTHVAGTIAGTGAGGQGADFSGVAPGASLVNLKIAEAHQGPGCGVAVCDIGWEMNALVAYEWAIENRNDAIFPGGIRIITNSWSILEADSDAEPISLIVKEAFRQGLVSTFAAGNAGPEPNTVAIGPNRVEEVITVGATCKFASYEETTTCKAGDIAGFSSRGKQVDVSAPGVGIWSTAATGTAGTRLAPPGQPSPQAAANNTARYVRFSGTSMATPHVAGIVALMLQANPKLKPAQVEQILIATSTDKGSRGFDTSFGFGFVNAQKAVAAGIALAKAKRRR